jgi:hypothetical protein
MKNELKPLRTGSRAQNRSYLWERFGFHPGPGLLVARVLDRGGAEVAHLHTELPASDR